MEVIEDPLLKVRQQEANDLFQKVLDENQEK
jgi:hypothetical protein